MKRRIVCISDVHLGTDAPSVWFQRDLHGPYLEAILRWVLDEADDIAELVLLGDIVDLWTYPIDQRPPTFTDITACHPNVFGADGLLAAVLDALDGAVIYVPGNHDQGVTDADVASIRSRGGHRVRLVEQVPYQPVPGLALAHGHHSTMFNAPWTTGPWAPLPIGYFVTRTVATKWAAELAPGTTVASLPGQGAPNGIDLSSLGTVVSGAGAKSVTGSLIDFVSGACGVDQEAPITMPDGSTTTLAEVKAEYLDCWTRWATDAGGGVNGHAEAARSAFADLDGSFLGWFAQRMALEHDAELVVMGHTHVPIGGLDDALVDYVNTGFDCPSQPDLARAEAPQQVTFAVVDVQDLEAQLWAASDVDGRIQCGPIEAPHTRVVGSMTADYSSYVIIDNSAGEHDLELVEATATSGTFVVAPPVRVPAGSMGRFWLQDNLGAAGSVGTATYRRLGTDAEPLVLEFSCPTLGTNACRGTAEFATRVGDGPWRELRPSPFGHPFFVSFEVT